jgi:hypothetical protein
MVCHGIPINSFYYKNSCYGMREEVSILLIVTGPRVRFATSNFCYNNGFAGLWGGGIVGAKSSRREIKAVYPRKRVLNH